MTENGSPGRLRRWLDAVMGTAPYDPHAAEAEFFRTVRERGFDAVTIFPSAETHPAQRSSYTAR